MKDKLIFVTNDDGYNSKGIQALIEVARRFGRVVAIAPETPQSGMSQAITMNNPLFMKEKFKEDGVEVYSFSGTPVDCVKFAFDYFLRGTKGRFGDLGNQPRLEFGGQHPLFGNDGGCDRVQLL